MCPSESQVLVSDGICSCNKELSPSCSILCVFLKRLGQNTPSFISRCAEKVTSRRLVKLYGFPHILVGLTHRNFGWAWVKLLKRTLLKHKRSKWLQIASFFFYPKKLVKLWKMRITVLSFPEFFTLSKKIREISLSFPFPEFFYAFLLTVCQAQNLTNLIIFSSRHFF